MAVLLFIVHRVPLYGVETDLFGEYIPAVRALLAGAPTAAPYEFKGPGYPLLLALSTAAALGDAWLGARILNLVAALAGAGFAFMVVRRAAGDTAALFVLAALCANPLYVQSTIEAGTDLPTFALGMAATHFVLTAAGPRRAALAGLLTGLAILCRYNAAALVPAGLVALALSRERSAPLWRLVAAYAFGLALPLLPWLVINRRISGGAFSNRNYANLAFELYGGDMRWDRFWEEVAPRFRSYADVLLYDPGRALLHWLRNLGTRWLLDLRQLVPVWIGVAAAIGALVHARRAGGRAGLLAHFGFPYATLALVFYAPRFFLYLVPFYLGSAALAFFPRRRVGAPLGRGLAIAGAVAVVASAVLAGRETVALLRDPPVEVVEAGRVLSAVARPGDRVLARKPQVAWFANMEYEPMPQVETVRELIAAARASGARYMNVSGIEGSLRPQFRLLSETDVELPGLTRLARDVSDPGHHFTLYRVEAAGPADAVFADSLVVALMALSARDPARGDVQAYVGALLLDEGRLAEALVTLDRAVALDPGAVQPRAFRAAALFDLGRFDEAASDCEQVIAALARPPAALHLLLGYVRIRQQRLDDAQASFAAAAQMEPATVSTQILLGASLLAGGRIEEGRAAMDRAVRLAPALAPLREAALEWARAGDRAGLVNLIERTRLSVARGESVESMLDPARPEGGK